MSAAAGPGPVPVAVDEPLPDGWEAFATNDGNRYFCFPRVYYYCRVLKQVQWERPGPEQEVDDGFAGPTINGKKPYERGDEFIPDPPVETPYSGPYSDERYKASAEDQEEDIYEPDEEMLDACLECDLPKLKKAFKDGADISLPNQPWLNTPLHLVTAPCFWDAETWNREKELRLELAKFLVHEGADVNAENAFSCKPLDFAVFHGFPAIAAVLEENGAQFSLMGAAFAGRLDVVKELLEDGADIDMPGRYGRTAFAEAHLRGQWRVECYLSQQGCSREVPHPEHMKFNPGGAALPRSNPVPKREKQYHREDDPLWYDDMMEKRFPGYADKMKKVPKE